MRNFFKDNYIFNSFVPISIIALLFCFVLNYMAIWFSQFINSKIDPLNFGLVGDSILVMYSFFSLRLICRHLEISTLKVSANTKNELIKMKISIDLYDKIYKIIFGISLVINLFTTFQNKLKGKALMWFVISYTIFLITTQVVSSIITYVKDTLEFD